MRVVGFFGSLLSDSVMSFSLLTSSTVTPYSGVGTMRPEAVEGAAPACSATVAVAAANNALRRVDENNELDDLMRGLIEKSNNWVLETIIEELQKMYKNLCREAQGLMGTLFWVLGEGYVGMHELP